MPTYEDYMQAARNADAVGDERAAKRLVQLATEAKTGDVDIATDVMKSIPSGVREGVETGFGGFGDIQQMNKGIAQGAVDAVGGPDWLRKGVGVVAENFPLPGAQSTERIKQGTEAIMGPNYQPQTKPGQIMGEATEWAVGAAPGGIPGMGRRLISGAIGGATSEVAGQAAEGTGLETPARVLSGIAASSAPGIVEGVARSALPSKYDVLRKATPSSDDIRAGSVQDYEQMRQAGMAFRPQSASRMVDNTLMKLDSRKFKRTSAPQTHAMMRELGKEVQEGTFDFGDLIAYRQRLKEITKAEGVEGGAAAAAIKEIDDFRSGLTALDFTSHSVNPQRANAMLKRADEDYRRSALSQDLQAMIDKAEMTAGTNFTMAGVHTALKREVKNYVNKSPFLKKKERKAMMEFAKSTDYAEMLKQLARMKSVVSSSAGAGGPAGLAALASGGDLALTGGAFAAGAGGLLGVGAAASAAAEREARRRIQTLDLMVRSGRIPPEQRADMVRRIMTETLGAGVRGAAVGTYNE